MLTGKQIVIIGGDARQLEVIRTFVMLDASVTLVGFHKKIANIVGATNKEIEYVDWNRIDAVILPIVGTTSHGVVESSFSDEVITLTKKHLQNTPPHCVIYTGISNAYLDQCAKESGRKLVKVMERDDVAIYNSIPTAEGIVMMAIQHMDITIHQSTVAIIGFGRVGQTVARIFSALGAYVRVFARKEEHIARIVEMGFTPFYTDELKEGIKEVDLCINTVPTTILTANVIAHMKKTAVIIDVASKPGGTDFRYAKKRGLKALLAPSLPGLVAPKTAGHMLAQVLATLIKKEGG